MEIIIKTKQKFNPFFSFLNYADVLFPYYTHVKEMIMTGGYIPLIKPEVSTNGSATRGGADLIRGGGAPTWNSTSQQERTPKVSDANIPDVKISSPKQENPSKGPDMNSNSDDDDDDDSDDDGGYLHPLLMKASLKISKPSTPEPAPSSPKISQAPPPNGSSVQKKLSVEELMNMHSKSSFVARSLAINSAPSLNRDVATHGQATPTRATYSEADAVAAYEHYKQQYYERYGRLGGA